MENNIINVKLDDLEFALTRVFENIRNGGFHEIYLDKDYYWFVPGSERYEIYEPPKNLTIGQLSEDLSCITKIARGEAEPIGHSLQWIAEVLLYISSKT